MFHHSVVKLHEISTSSLMIDFVMEKTAKKSGKYGEYGSFMLLLYLVGNIIYYASAMHASLHRLMRMKREI